MADPTHIAKLRAGVKSWNCWRKSNPDVIPDLKKADLRQTNLRKADFSQADLSFARLDGAILDGAIFRQANLSGANFSNSDLTNVNFDQARLKFANFSNSKLFGASLYESNLQETNFIKANLCGANLTKANLGGAYLGFANLSEARLSAANLTAARLRLANLQDVDLSAVRALEADFTGVNFTGACVQRWQIDVKTNLEGVQCDYIYLGRRSNSKFFNRSPKNRIFNQGEFTQKYQKLVKLPDLLLEDIFEGGMIDFFEYFQELQKQQDNKTFIVNKIESRGDNKLAVRLEVSSEDSLESARRKNEEQLQLAEASYKIQMQSELIEFYQRHHAHLMELAKLNAARPFNLTVEANSMSSSTGSSNSFNIQNSSINNLISGDNARQENSEHNYTTETKCLVDAAKEIQELLDQLSQSYSAESQSERVVLANEAVRRISNNSLLRQRILGALKAGSFSAVEQFLNHPAASFVVSALEEWRKQV